MSADIPKGPVGSQLDRIEQGQGKLLAALNEIMDRMASGSRVMTGYLQREEERLKRAAQPVKRKKGRK